MQAVVIHETGGPEVLQMEQVDPPEPGEGEVLVRVKAASVNPIDYKRRRDRAESFPVILGHDISGTVEASRAEEFSDDEEVFGLTPNGAYAELATAPAGNLARKPEGVGDEQAATIPVAGGTAWEALFDVAGLQSGQTALIAGAAGGVGHFAVQFARHAGARVIGTGSSRNRDFVLGLGADEYVDYTEQDVAEAASDVDVAFDAVGGDTTQTLVPVMRESGILVTIAGNPPVDAAQERGIRAELLVSSPSGERYARIAELIASGEVRPDIAEILPLSEVQRAHELSESGHTRGKIVLKVGA
jgi:NADPH:quinone reductase-like Zn-dependent oxidoreductase